MELNFYSICQAVHPAGNPYTLIEAEVLSTYCCNNSLGNPSNSLEVVMNAYNECALLRSKRQTISCLQNLYRTWLRAILLSEVIVVYRKVTRDGQEPEFQIHEQDFVEREGRTQLKSSQVSRGKKKKRKHLKTATSNSTNYFNFVLNNS